MKNEIVKSEKFEKSKKKLQTFSKILPNSSRITPVSEKTFFGVLNSKVTGEDLNIVVKNFQSRTIQTNKCLKQIIEEFKTIYDTFESLDNDYIQSILVAIKSAEKSSEQSDKNYKIIEGLINKLQNKFKNIESQYELITEDLKTLSIISEKLNKIEYLHNIDVTYKQVLENKSTINELEKSVINSHNELKFEIANKSRHSPKNSLTINKEYSNKLTIVSIIAVLSLLLSITMIVINLINNG